MRRALLALAAVGMGLVAVTSPATAGEPVQGGDYAGSRITIPATVTSAEHPLTAEISRQLRDREWLDVTVTLTGPTGLPAVCPAPTPTAPVKVSATGAGNNVWLISTPATAPCNGVHKVSMRVMRCGNALGGLGYCDAGIVLTDEYTVAARPATVTNVRAQKEGAGVEISWTRSSPTAPDFLGYRVERQTAKDTWKKVADVGKTTASVTDEEPPTAGKVTYRVVGRRAAPPSGEITSTGGEVELDLAGGDDSTTTTMPGQTDGGPAAGDGAGDGTGGTPTTAGGGGSGTSGGGRTTNQPRGQTGGFPKAPRLGTTTNFPPLLAADPFDEEGGEFEETLDYGRSLAGDGGGGDLSSIIFDDEESGRGMAVPVATGFVLAAWAFHLRFLARAARPIPPS